MNAGFAPQASRRTGTTASHATGRRRRLAALALAAAAIASVQAAPAIAATPGPPSFATATNLDAAGARSYDVALGDLNGDGKRDIVSVNRASGNISVFLGNGNGTFAPVTTYPGGTFMVSVALADVNGDHNLDVVAQDSSNGNALVLLGDGAGHLGPKATVDLTGSGGSDFPLSIVVADVNEDGKPDIVSSNANSDNLSFVAGNGNGTFAAPVSVGLNGADFPEGLTVADLNKDGHLDVAVAVEPLSGHGRVMVLLGDGSGGFAPAVSYALGGPDDSSFPTGVKVADVNEDGNPDLIVDNGVGGSISVLLGDGSGAFGTATVLPVGSGGGSGDYLAVGDLNGDGHVDVAMDHAGVTVFTGDGHGGFGAPVSFPVPSGPEGLAIGDLNADGLPDIVAADANGDASNVKDVSVLLNTSSLSTSADITLNAKVAAYVALEGGAGNFGDVTPGFTDKIYTTVPGLKVATTSPAGVLVTVRASDPSNTHLGGLGEVTVLVNKYLLETATNPDAWEPTWTPMGSPVPLFLSTGPVNKTDVTVPYKLVIPGGKVLRKGDVYSENVTYTATSTMP